MTGTVARDTTTTYRQDEFRPYLPKEDPYQVNRLVGFYEYSQALQHLDGLARSATATELDAIDTIVKSEPEFTVFTNLARRLEQGRSTLFEQPEQAGDDFSRRGIRWVTALARVELGAMLAGYTEHPNPFAAVAGAGYDAAEFRELILDGAKMHYWSLSGDAEMKRVFDRFAPDSRTLAYIRRLNVGNAFVSAAGVVGNFGLDTPQAAELTKYHRSIGDYRAGLQAQIAIYLTAVQRQTSSRTSGPGTPRVLEMCQRGICRQFGDNPNPAPK